MSRPTAMDISSPIDWSQTRIRTSIDCSAAGRQIGDLQLPHSDNANPLGYYPIPMAVLNNGPGPTLLLLGGTHGDEFEGPAAILRLIHSLDLNTLRGRIIALPAINAPALFASSRCSPLDGGNLNRAFPGDRDGQPTAMIAALLETVLMPHCNAAIDFHAGGKAAVYAPVSMLNPSPGDLFAANLRLAEAFGAQLNWIMGASNDDRSVNAAAQRQDVPMFAVELGGGGVANSALVDLAESGILRVMAALEMLLVEPPKPPAEPLKYVEIRAESGSLFAPRDGLFVGKLSPGARVQIDQPIGTLYSLSEPERTPLELHANCAGICVSVSQRGSVKRGEFLVLVASERHRPGASEPLRSGTPE